MQEIKDIPRVSLDKIVSIFNKMPGDAYVLGCLIASRSSKDAKENISKHNFSLSHPFSLNAFIFLMCKDGSFDVRTNNKVYHIEKNGIFVNFPGQIMYVDNDVDGLVKAMAIDVEYIQNQTLDIKPIIHKLLSLKDNQYFQLSDAGFTEICDIIDAIATEISNNNYDDNSREIVRCLMAAVFFKLCRIIEASVRTKVSSDDFNKNAGYFKEFLILLGENYKTERSVGFYAERMHLSPKYFTTLIKRASGSTVAQWINHYVILEAKNLLKYSTMNVQEIAYTLNFPNQSFFGKYFKHHTGMTPSEYKKSK